VQRVVDGVALAQKLGIPGDPDVPARRGLLTQPGPDPSRGADRHGRLADDKGPTGQESSERRDRRVEGGELGSVAPRALRGADTEEVDLSLCRVGAVGRERQPARLDATRQQRVEPGLVERRVPL
jgi:hypothetical protein